jgi:hypothetical protein
MILLNSATTPDRCVVALVKSKSRLRAGTGHPVEFQEPIRGIRPFIRPIREQGFLEPAASG